MPLLGAVLAVLVLALFVLALAALVSAENKRRNEAMEAAAQRFSGQIEKSFWSGQSLRFEVEGVPAELTYFGGTDKAPPWTKVHFSWPGPALRLGPERTWASIKKFFGAEDIQVGDQRFDDAFLIQGEPSWVNKALTPQAQSLIWTLYGLGATSGFWGRSKGINLDVTPAGVILKCMRNHVRTRDDLLVFLETSVALLSALKRANGGAISLSVAEVVKAGKCPVCSDSSGQITKRCKGCNSAYHPECWDYLGGCAIFGCEDRYPPRQKEQDSEGW